MYPLIAIGRDYPASGSQEIKDLLAYMSLKGG